MTEATTNMAEWNSTGMAKLEEIQKIANQGAMLFLPNMTGPLHVAGAIVLWLTAREARQRGLRVVVRFDDRPPGIDYPGYTPQTGARDIGRIADTIESVRQACELLDIEGAEYSFRSHYTERYQEVAGFFAERDLLRTVAHIHRIPKSAAIAHDAILGEIFDVTQIVWNIWNCGFSRTFVTLVDFWDFKVPLHIRGQDIMHAAVAEARLFPTMLEVLGERPPMLYAHIPHIYRKDGTPLHKSLQGGPCGIGEPQVREEDSSDLYNFGTWARKFGAPQDRRAALERIVLRPGMPYALENMFNAMKAVLLYDPESDDMRYRIGAGAAVRAMDRSGCWDWMKGRRIP